MNLKTLTWRTLGTIAAALFGAVVAQADVPPPTPKAPTDKEIIDNPLNKPGPRYPQNAYEAGIEGYVQLEVVIAPDGIVSSAKVLKAEPSGWFEAAALEAVKQWRYPPAGREIVFKVSIDFQIPPSMRLPP